MSKRRVPKVGQQGPNFQLTSLDQSYRKDIVDLSGAPGMAGHAFIDTNTFELTALGANLDLSANWSSPNYDLIHWAEVATLGREQHAVTVIRGWLVPFGIPASLTTIYDRVFIASPGNSRVTAYLEAQSFIQVTQPTVTYPAYGQPFEGRTWPFHTLTALTLRTPTLDTDQYDLIAKGTRFASAAAAFVPTVGGGDVQWSVRVTDAAGASATLAMPQIFVHGYDANKKDENPFDIVYMEKVRLAWDGLADSRRTADLPGTPLQIAGEGSGAAGSTTHPVLSIRLAAATTVTDPQTTTKATGAPSAASLKSAGQPAMYPSIEITTVRLTAAEALTRSSVGGVDVSFYPYYVEHGYAAASARTDEELAKTAGNQPADVVGAVQQNAGQVYGKLANQLPNLGFPTDAVGGLGNPAAQLSGLSTIAGSIAGDVNTYAQNAKAEATEYFQDLKGAAQQQISQLLGGLKFIENYVNGEVTKVTGIVKGFVAPAENAALAEANNLGVPQLIQTYDELSARRTIKYNMLVFTQVYYGPGIDPDDPGTSPPLFSPADKQGNATDDDGALALDTTVVIDPKGTSSYTSKGQVTPFVITLIPQFPCIEIPFLGVTFSSASGGKTSLNVQVGTVRFVGELDFINAIEAFLKNLGGSGLSIDVEPSQVAASLSLAVPALSFGCFSLTGLSFAADLTIPFLGAPTVSHFALASHDHPFSLTVCMFGGGGYVTLGLQMITVESMAISFDFQGQFALDLVVASGSVSIMGGVTYTFTQAAGTNLTAFVNISGEVEALGIVTLSLELDFGLTYSNPGNGQSVLQGTGELEATIAISFFHKSLDIQVTKVFGNGGGSSRAVGASESARKARLAGAGAADDDTPIPVNSFAGIMATSDDWSDYCLAFAG